MYSYIVDGIWHDGDEQALRQFAPAEIHYPGVFETLRTYKTQPFLIDQHLDRAEKGLAVMSLMLPCSKQELIKKTQDVIDRSRRQNVKLRLSFWQQRKKMHYAITATPFQTLTPQAYRVGFQTMFVRRQRDEHDRFSDVKSLDYEAYLSAFKRAKIRHCDEALLVNQMGHVYEGSRTNLFVVRDGVLHTPSLQSGCLNGITRQHVLGLSTQIKLPVKERLLTKQDVLEAEEIFLTSSTLEVMPVTLIEGIEKKAGPLTERVRSAYQKTLP